MGVTFGLVRSQSPRELLSANQTNQPIRFGGLGDRCQLIPAWQTWPGEFGDAEKVESFEGLFPSHQRKPS